MNPEMNIFILDNEQPTCCPKCGTRTDFEEVINRDKTFQMHHCANKECLYEFIGEFESEELIAPDYYSRL